MNNQAVWKVVPRSEVDVRVEDLHADHRDSPIAYTDAAALAVSEACSPPSIAFLGLSNLHARKLCQLVRIH